MAKTFINWIACIGIAIVFPMALAIPMAHANPMNDRLLRDGNRQGNKLFQQQQRNPREAERPYARRNEGGEERPQRLSPEERRQLRRDIKDAGREIYPQRK